MFFPFPGRLAEQSHIEHIGFAGVGERLLLFGNQLRDQVVFDGVGVDLVVDFGNDAIHVPLKRDAAVFIGLEALIILDDVELELGGDPGSKLKGDILVGKGAAVSP